MSGVQGGLGEQKRDILKLREEALLEHGTGRGRHDTPGTLHTPVLLMWDTGQVNGLTVKSASHEVDISKLGDVTWR